MSMMSKLAWLAPALIALLLSGCHAVNDDLSPRVQISRVVIPDSLVGGTEVQFDCEFLAEAGAVRLDWDFGGGASPDNTSVPNAQSPDAQTVTLAEVSEPTEFALTVFLFDVTNNNRRDQMQVTYVVDPPPPPAP